MNHFIRDQHRSIGLSSGWNFVCSGRKENGDSAPLLQLQQPAASISPTTKNMDCDTLPRSGHSCARWSCRRRRHILPRAPPPPDSHAGRILVSALRIVPVSDPRPTSRPCFCRVQSPLYSPPTSHEHHIYTLPPFV
ncbi:hypothetical protein B484DRAFT_450030 [Ochromonadaceae sp. CCMP2298]|nr:hypothetical protein B484DRAFT_450030 [Ochromonadaceae sp. CCMP2298]